MPLTVELLIDAVSVAKGEVPMRDPAEARRTIHVRLDPTDAALTHGYYNEHTLIVAVLRDERESVDGSCTEVS